MSIFSHEDRSRGLLRNIDTSLKNQNDATSNKFVIIICIISCRVISVL